MTLTKELKALPDLKSLLLKAAVAKGSGAKELPALVCTLNGIKINPSELKAYNKVCGFKDRAVIPPTYLHMFAFPMFMDMFIDKRYPFKVMGMVHVRNSITQHRQIRCSEVIDMRCELTNLQEVDQGFECDVLATARVGDELVWESTITNLTRTKKAPAKKAKKEHEALDWSDWNQQAMAIPADVGRRYAKVAGDYNPIHLYPWTAKLLGFKKAIAHGMWTKANLLAKSSAFYMDEQAFTIDVKFKLPVFLPAKVNVLSKSENGVMHAWVRDQKTDKPHLEASITIK